MRREGLSRKRSLLAGPREAPSGGAAPQTWQPFCKTLGPLGTLCRAPSHCHLCAQINLDLLAMKVGRFFICICSPGTLGEPGASLTPQSSTLQHSCSSLSNRSCPYTCNCLLSLCPKSFLPTAAPNLLCHPVHKYPFSL